MFIVDFVGGSREGKLGVSGDSAGGRLAAVVCHEAHQVIDFAVSSKHIIYKVNVTILILVCQTCTNLFSEYDSKGLRAFVHNTC